MKLELSCSNTVLVTGIAPQSQLSSSAAQNTGLYHASESSAIPPQTGRAVLDAYSRDRQIQPLDQSIGCLEEAVKTSSPDNHQPSFDLANLLAVRFFVHHVDNDYEEAKKLLDSITFSCSPGDPYRFQASALTTALKYARSIMNSNLEDSERAVSLCRSFLNNSLSFGDPLHPVITELLTSHVERASKHFGSLQGAQATHLPFSTQSGIFGDVEWGTVVSDCHHDVPPFTRTHIPMLLVSTSQCYWRS
jgi:hypothetical protein